MCPAFSFLEKEVCELSKNKLIQWKKVLLSRLLIKWAKTECKVNFSYFVLLCFIIIIIYFLKLWYMFTMYFDHIHTLQVSLTFHKTCQIVSLFHSKLYVLFFILYYYSSHSFLLVVVVDHWVKLILFGKWIWKYPREHGQTTSTSISKLRSLTFLINHQMPIVSLLRIRPWELLLHPCWNFKGSYFVWASCRQPWLVWVDLGIGYIMSREQHFIPCPHLCT